MPYGKRRKAKVLPQIQGTMLYDDAELGINKTDFTSPPVTLTWMNLQAIAPPKHKGIHRTIKKAFCRSKEVEESQMLLKGGEI